MKHLLATDGLAAEQATAVLDTADELKRTLLGREVRKLPTLRGRTVITMFYENSTRTRVSFEIAGKWMSADVINVSAGASSVGKGESLRDTALTLSAAGADCVIIRHPASGAAHRLAGWLADTPTGVVNAGTARMSTRPRPCWTPPPCGSGSASWPGAGSASSATCCTAGSPGRTCTCWPRWAPRWC